MGRRGSEGLSGWGRGFVKAFQNDATLGCDREAHRSDAKAYQGTSRRVDALVEVK